MCWSAVPCLGVPGPCAMRIDQCRYQSPSGSGEQASTERQSWHAVRDVAAWPHLSAIAVRRVDVDVGTRRILRE